MAQGWAGERTPSKTLECAACLILDRSVPARTQAEGTLLCLKHLDDWISKPVLMSVSAWMKRFRVEREAS